jgi:putative methionine-R-sulfoxide reductase with GAF domain
MKERDEILQSFSRGARLTEHFVAEYSRMHERVMELESDNSRLRAQLEADDAMARLVAQVERLEEERKELLSRTQKAEAAQGEIDQQFNDVEDQFAALANLFVASNQLHASLTPRGVVRRIKEILAQLVGAEAYAMYLASYDTKELVPIASEGVPGNKLHSISMTDSIVGKVVQKGKAVIDEDRPSNDLDFDNPPVVVPLVVDETAVGVIAIYATLEQKPRFSHTDFELFKLLGQHAASALVGAALFEQAGRKLPGAEAFRDLSV